jgi:NAD(P)-dependent dehydrogenase (short-subunit alcohol dehydrogenase family)
MSKTILITGASSGIGRAAVRRFADNGWNVAATMPNPSAAGDLIRMPTVLVTRLDVRDDASIATSIAEAKARFGRIDAVLSNAGFGQYGVFEAISTEQVRHQFDVNVFGAMNLLRAILPEFRANGGGHVIVTSSAGGIYGLPVMSLYIATKFALEGFFESVSYELAAQNIKVKLIEPGGVATGFHDTAARKSSAAGGLAAYQTFYDSVTAAVNEKVASHSLASADDVAHAIYEAATDNSDRLRYVVGEDAAAIISARRMTSEREFMDLIRAGFGLANVARA